MEWPIIVLYFYVTDVIVIGGKMLLTPISLSGLLLMFVEPCGYQGVTMPRCYRLII